MPTAPEAAMDSPDVVEPLKVPVPVTVPPSVIVFQFRLKDPACRFSIAEMVCFVLMVRPIALFNVRFLIFVATLPPGITCAAVPLKTSVPVEASVVPLLLLMLPLMVCVVEPML